MMLGIAMSIAAMCNSDAMQGFRHKCLAEMSHCVLVERSPGDDPKEIDYAILRCYLKMRASDTK